MNTESKYAFNGSMALAEAHENHQFCELFTTAEGIKNYSPVEVGEVVIQKTGEESFCLVAKCWSEQSGYYVLNYSISKKDYLQFIEEKNKRLKILLKYTKENLFVRKMRAQKHIDVRMTEKLYNQICKDAESCKKNPSAYLRELATGKRPRKALTNDEFEIMQDFVKVYRNYLNFFNATKGIMKGWSPEQKMKYIIDGQAYSWFRRFIIEGLPVMQRLIEGGRMQVNKVWIDAQGKQLPKYGRAVIAIIPDGTDNWKVVVAHRSKENGWSQPDIAYWFDVELPKREQS